MKAVAIPLAGLLVAALAGCASPQQAGTGPRSPNQVKQQALKQMEAQGQRNDFDKVRID